MATVSYTPLAASTMLESVFRGIVARRTAIVVAYALLALPAARIAIGIPSDDAIVLGEFYWAVARDDTVESADNTSPPHSLSRAAGLHASPPVRSAPETTTLRCWSARDRRVTDPMPGMNAGLPPSGEMDHVTRGRFEPVPAPERPARRERCGRGDAPGQHAPDNARRRGHDAADRLARVVQLEPRIADVTQTLLRSGPSPASP